MLASTSASSANLRPEHMFLQYMESRFNLPTFHLSVSSQEGGGTVVFMSSSVPEEVRPC